MVRDAIALREHAVVAEGLRVLPAPRVQFLEHAVHPGSDEALLGRTVVFRVEDADALAHVDDVVLHAEVVLVRDRREQFLLALPAVALLEEVVGLTGERVELRVDLHGNVIVEFRVESLEQVLADVLGEHRQRVGLHRALVPVLFVSGAGVAAVAQAALAGVGGRDVPLDGVAAAVRRLRVLAQPVDQTPLEFRFSGRRGSLEPDDLLVFRPTGGDRPQIVDEPVEHLGVAEDRVLAVVVRIVEEAVTLLLLALLDDGPGARCLDRLE